MADLPRYEKWALLLTAVLHPVYRRLVPGGTQQSGAVYHHRRPSRQQRFLQPAASGAWTGAARTVCWRARSSI